MKKEVFYLVILFAFVFIINYRTIDDWLIKEFGQNENVFVLRIIDGDTIVTDIGRIRLLGINSPEKGEIGYTDALNFLKSKILEKNITIVFEGEKKDKYKRYLAYIYYNGENINLESVRRGYSNYYFPKKSPMHSKFKTAWNECLRDGLNLCKKSRYNCVDIDYSNVDNQKISIINKCSYNLDIGNWSIKDEGRKKYVFKKFILSSNEFLEIGAENFGKKYVWTKSGDSIIIRDADGLLVYFEDIFRD